MFFKSAAFWFSSLFAVSPEKRCKGRRFFWFVQIFWRFFYLNSFFKPFLAFFEALFCDFWHLHRCQSWFLASSQASVESFSIFTGVSRKFCHLHRCQSRFLASSQALVEGFGLFRKIIRNVVILKDYIRFIATDYSGDCLQNILGFIISNSFPRLKQSASGG